MARHSNHEAARLLGERLSALRDQAGRPTYSRIERGVIGILGDERAPTSETIRRLHSGEADPSGTSPEVLIALARFYGVEPDQLGPEVADRVASLRLLLGPGSTSDLADTRGLLAGQGGNPRRAAA